MKIDRRRKPSEVPAPVPTDDEANRPADEAEQGHDVSWQEPILPTIWVAELLTGKDAIQPGRIVTRTILTNRTDAELALAAHWRVVCYVRADFV